MYKRSGRKTRRQNPDQTTTRKGRLFRIIKRTALISLALVILVIGTAFFLARSEPGYWKEHQRFLQETSPTQIAALAAQVEKKIRELANLGLDGTTHTQGDVASWMQDLTRSDDASQGEADQSRINPEDVHINVEQTISFNNDQLAAIVQTRLDEWMQERGYVQPQEVMDPMIAVRDGQLVMAFRVQSGQFGAIISGKFTLNILDNGMAELTLKRFLVGQLPVPADMLGQHLRESSGGDTRMAEIGEWLGKLQYLQVKPVLELEHRRRARVMEYKILDDGVELIVRVQDHKTYKAMNEALADVPVD